MANEGSTKPTYSELEAENFRVRGLLQRQCPCHSCSYHASVIGNGGSISSDGTITPPECDYSAAKFCYYCGAGLLGHDCERLKIPGPRPYPKYCPWCGSGPRDIYHPKKHHPDCKPVYLSPTPTFPQSSSLMSQGAESADIGKLDTAPKRQLSDFPQCADCLGGDCDGVNHFVASADKSGVEMGKVNRVESDTIELAKKICREVYGDESLSAVTVIADTISYIEHRPGSAETGGEKAAPQKDDRRRTAHSMPINSDSREPEKLNNAHQCCNRSAYDATRRCSKVSQHSGECVFPALAESFLSSPPPTACWHACKKGCKVFMAVGHIDNKCTSHGLKLKPCS